MILEILCKLLLIMDNGTRAFQLRNGLQNNGIIYFLLDCFLIAFLDTFLA